MLALKNIGLGFVITILTVFSGTSAWGHAELKGSSPAKDEVVVLLPNSISVTFGEELLVLGEEEVNTLAVRDSFNEDLSLIDVTVEGDTISATVNLSSPVLAGEYRIIYRVVSADGHPIEGEIPFIYAPEDDMAVDEEPLPVEESAEAQVESTKSEGLNSVVIGAIIAFVVVVGALLLLRKRK